MFTAIDYSQIASQIAGCSMNSRREGKAVVICNDVERYIVFAPLDFCRLHSDIVNRFFELRRIRTREVGDQILPIIDSWKILGGCHFEIDDDSHTLSLFSDSTAYGGVDVQWMRIGLLETEEFKSYRIVVAP